MLFKEKVQNILGLQLCKYTYLKQKKILHIQKKQQVKKFFTQKSFFPIKLFKDKILGKKKKILVNG